MCIRDSLNSDLRLPHTGKDPPQRECAHPGRLTCSAQSKSMGSVGTRVEYSTQWCGKPLIPLGPAPGRNHSSKKIYGTDNSVVPYCPYAESKNGLI